MDNSKIDKIEVGDIVITDELTGFAHLNGRPLSVIATSATHLKCTVLIDRSSDPNKFTDGSKRNTVSAKREYFRKL